MSPRELLSAHREAADPVAYPVTARCRRCLRVVAVSRRGLVEVHQTVAVVGGRAIPHICPGSADPASEAL